MASISQNQYDYLTNLAKGNDGNAIWAKAQLQGATVTPAQAVNNDTIYQKNTDPAMQSKWTDAALQQANVKPASYYQAQQQTSPSPGWDHYPDQAPVYQRQQEQSATLTPTVTPTQSAPTSTAPYTLSQAQIAAEAKARLDKQRAALAQSVNATKAGLKNTFDYQNQLTNDRRTLENTAFQRQNNPFSGRSDYLAADLARTRSIQDTATNKDYAAAVGAADQKLADFDSMSPEQQQSIIDDLTRIERDYGLQVGQLTGSFNGGQTLAARTADQNYQLALAGLTGQIGGQNTMQKQQQNIDNALKLSQLYGTNVNPADSGSVLFGQVSGMTPIAVQQQNIDNMWKQAEVTGTIPNQLADMYGIPRGTQTMQAKQMAANIANQNADNTRLTNSANQDALYKQWQATGKAPAGIPGVQEGTSLYKAPSSSGGSGGSQPKNASSAQFNDLFDTMQKRYGVANYKTDSSGKYVTNPDGSAIVTYSNPTNADQRAKIVLDVLNYGLSDDDTLKMLNKFGITEEEARKLVGG